MRSFVLFVVCLWSASVNAAPVTIDFEEFTTEQVKTGWETLNPFSISSKGYDLTANGTTCGDPDIRIQRVSSAGLYVQQLSSEPPVCTVGITMARSDAGAFAIHSFDMYGGGFDYFGGSLAGGGIADLSVAVGTGDWLNLVSFAVYREDIGIVGVGLDNISVSAVPIPTAFWLFGSGLGLLGWMRRRQTA